VDVVDAFPEVRVYRSLFGTDGFLEWQGLCNQDLVQEELTDRYARLWKDFLDGSVPFKQECRHPLSSKLETLSSRGVKLSSDIMKASKQKPLPLKRIALLGEQEAAVEAEIKLLGSCDPSMAPLVDFLTLTRENISGDDLYTIARQSHSLYQQGQRLAAFL